MTSSPSDPDRPSAAPRLRFQKSQHLCTTAEFDRVYAVKQRAGDDQLLIFAALNDLGRTRIGLSVSRKHGNSVRRHHLKRLLREAFRLRQHDMPVGLDLVLIPRPNPEASMVGYQESLLRLARRLADRLQRSREREPAPAPPRAQP